MTVRVFGVSKIKILRQARIDLDINNLTPDEFEVKCEKEADLRFIKARPSSISGNYDAPQFCHDFIILCRGHYNDKFKKLSVRRLSNGSWRCYRERN